MESFKNVMTGWIREFGPRLLEALAIAAVGWLVLRILVGIADRAMKRTKLDVSLQAFLLRVIRIAGYVIIVITLLSSLNVSTTGLIAGFSAAVAAIALALKDSLSNVAAGIILLFTHPFETGDYICVGEEAGHVKRIDVIHTTLVTLDNRQVILPNSLLSSHEVVNYTGEAIRRVDLPFSIRYSDDVETAKQAALEAAAAHTLVLTDPAPVARIERYDDSAVIMTVRIWCKTPDYWDVYFDMTEQVRAALEQHGAAIPFPQLDVHMIPEETE